MSSNNKGSFKINKRPKDDYSDDEKADNNGPRLTLGYWKIQGLASAARMMLVYKGVDFENKMYEVTTKANGEYDMSDWLDVKFKLDLDFPNLPYIIDNKTEMRLSSSKSVYRYIARQFGIGVQADPDLAVADMMLEMIGQVMGVESPLTRSSPFIVLSYGTFDGKYTQKDFEAAKAKYLEELPALLKPIEDFMANKHYVTGHAISYADFVLYYLCVTHTKLDAKVFAANCPNLSGFHKRFGALDGMKKWHTSEYSKLPFNNVMAMFK